MVFSAFFSFLLSSTRFRSVPQEAGVYAAFMEPLQLLGHSQSVLMIGHAEPPVPGLQHGHLQPSLAYELPNQAWATCIRP